jgi:hypothetical protein
MTPCADLHCSPTFYQYCIASVGRRCEAEGTMTASVKSLDLGVLKRLDVHSIWAKEASQFTPWLADNLHALGDAINLELELTTTEAPCGDFSVDIVARDVNEDRPVVIENQLTATDHDHLGKLMTYAAGHDAGTIVWIAPSFREEHRAALDWLNLHSDTNTQFFGVVIEALQIDDSKLAYNFRLVAAPNDWNKKAPGLGGEPSAKGKAYQRFFQQLIDELREKHKFTQATKGQPQNWYSFASGVSGVVYSVSFAQGGKLRAELYIDLGDRDENKSLFDQLHGQKQVFEQEYGMPLTWERLNERQASRVAVYRPGTIDESESALAAARQWMIQQLLELKKLFGAAIKASG